VTDKKSVGIHFELDPDVNKGLERDSLKYGRSKRKHARHVLNAFYSMPETERDYWLGKTKLPQ
jgi:hypothetical protein